jgi:hypothetical protein
MPSSRKLKSVAAGLLGSFVSRNNDIGGYWGIGVLCRDTAAMGGKVELNLITRVAAPATASCELTIRSSGPLRDVAVASCTSRQRPLSSNVSPQWKS